MVGTLPIRGGALVDNDLRQHIKTEVGFPEAQSCAGARGGMICGTPLPLAMQMTGRLNVMAQGS